MKRFDKLFCSAILFIIGIVLLGNYYIVISPLQSNLKLIKEFDTLECNQVNITMIDFVPFMTINIIENILYLDTEYRIHQNQENVNKCTECNWWFMKYQDISDITCKVLGSSYFITVNGDAFCTNDLVPCQYTGGEFADIVGINFGIFAILIILCAGYQGTRD